MAQFGFSYDERMLEHKCNYDSTMAERPERIELIYKRLVVDQLLDEAVKIEAREATDAELLLNHPQELLDQVKALETDEQCEQWCKDKEILWMCPESDQAARLAAGCSIDIVNAAVEGRISNGFAIVRPPGHHSYGALPQGYCVFNNVAVAAKYAVDVLGLERVAIVDFDYHPGNGTYFSVKDDPRIHFTSFHAYHNGAFWPFSRQFDYGTSSNQLFVPLNASLNSEGEYVSVFHHVLLPMLRQFSPELIIISAGFDAGYYDIMMGTGQAVKAHGYGHMARLLDEICPGRTVAVLEGGYFPDNYTECAAMMVRGLKRMALPSLEIPERINGALTETVWHLLHHHADAYPELKSKLEKLKDIQVSLGLDEFKHDRTLFLGDRMRKIYDSVKRARCVRTREWFPELTDEQVQECRNHINAYKQQYEFKREFAVPSEEELLGQLVWDDEARSDAYIRSTPFAMILINEFNDFLEGRIDHMMICDRVLYDAAVEDGEIEKLEPFRTM